MIENEDHEELDEINARMKNPDLIIAAAKAQMENCWECHGAKTMSYLRFLPPPWYARLLGKRGIEKWFQSGAGRRWDRDVPCKRCGGTGREVMHSGGVDAAAGNADNEDTKVE
jgi:hypothetical protein